MKERVLEFLKKENKSSAVLAEEIGVQPSGISHILSGRNNPSLDFVLKMLNKYKFLSSDWLLFGRGSMYKEPRMTSLFDENYLTGYDKDNKAPETRFAGSDSDLSGAGNDLEYSGLKEPPDSESSSVKKIVWFYGDNSFEEYYPRE